MTENLADILNASELFVVEDDVMITEYESGAPSFPQEFYEYFVLEAA